MSSSSRSADRFRERYGPWAVVTGASSGIGRACALHLARAGLGVVLVARDRASLDDVAARAQRDGAPATRVLTADLGDPAGVRAVAEGTLDLDVGLLVAAAGFGTSGPFLDSDVATELDMLDVNCRAVLSLTHSLGGRMAARGSGGVVLLGSVVGFQGTPGAAHYAATKAYVQTLAEGLHRELRPLGVDVLASAPGPVDSGFGARAGMTMGRALDPDTVAAGTLAALGRTPSVAPGTLSKVLGWSLAPLPRTARTRILGRVMAGMTEGGVAEHGASGRRASKRGASRGGASARR